MAASRTNQLRALLLKNWRLKTRNRRELLNELLYPLFMTTLICSINRISQPTDYPAEPHHNPQPVAVGPVWGGFNPPPAAEVRSLLFAIDGPNAAEYKQFVTKEVIPKVEAELKSGFFNNTLTDWRPPSIKAEFVATADLMLERYLANTTLFWAGVNFTFAQGSAENQPVLHAMDASYTIWMKEHDIDYGSPFVQDADRFSKASLPNTNDSFTEAQCRNQNYDGPANSSLMVFFEQECDTGLYWSSGFLALQSALDAALCGIEKEKRAPVLLMQEAPRSQYILERSGPLQPIAIMMIIMGFAPWVQFLMVHIVGEKEHGIKEAMYLMGMKVEMYWLSWFLTYSIMSIVPCIAMTIVTKTMGLFSNANVMLIFLILESFSLSIISLGMLLSNFFKQAKTAGLVGMLSMTVISLSIFAIKDLTSGAIKGLCSLISPLAACFALQTTLAIDATEGLHWKQFVSVSDGFSPLAATGMLLFDAVLYFILTLVVDMVIVPSEKGLLDFCKIKLSGSLYEDRSRIETTDAAICEEVSAELAAKKALSVISVEKTFGSGAKAKHALKGVSFDLYEGQIFALLGHNGAGKSTMHTIVSGHIRPTKGTVSIYGHDVTTAAGRDSVREIMGVCPQHDILYDKLTVQEHMALFGAIKGVESERLKIAIQEGMKEVHLHTQSGVQSERLSGGQKRKLSVALALIGDPKVICLDEPTSGMDPLSRRQLWDLLQAKRPGRVMLFTTHQMDEADILADRKAVLSHGKVQCLGSSLFLKTRFGLGYHLNVVKRQEVSQVALSRVVQQHFPELPIEVKNVGIAQGETSECVYELPLKGLKQFSTLFSALDANASELGVVSYGVSMTTLDEVFLRLADEEGGASDSSGDHAPNIQEDDVKMLDLSGISSGDSSDEELLLEEGSTSINSGGSIAPARLEMNPNWRVQLWALMVVRAKQMLRTPMALQFQIVAPCILLVIGLVVVMKPSALNTWDNNVTIQLTPGVSSPAAPMPFFVDPNYKKDPEYFETLGEILKSTGINISDVSNENSGSLEDFYIKNQKDSSAVVYPAAVKFGKTNTTLMYDPGSIHALPSYVSALNDASCKMYPNERRGKNVTSVTAFSRPLPVSRVAGFDTGTFNTVLFVGMAISVIPGGFAVDLVRDRKLKNKHQLFTSGTPLSIYFAAYFLMNVLMMLIPVTVGIILMLGMNVTALIGPALPVTIIFMLLYTPLTILAAFVGSYLFTEPDTCQSQLPPAINLAGFMPYIVVGVMDAAGHSDSAIALHYILCIVDPPYTLLGAMYFIFRVDLANNAQIASKVLTTADYFAKGTHLTATLLIMLAQCGIFSGILWMIEFGWKKCCPTKALAGAAADDDDDEEEVDDDVEKAGEFANSSAGRTALIRLTGLAKSFAAKGPVGSARKQIKRAVRGLSFGVSSGEVLGLLGPNGAGKTTTISILTGEQQASEGGAYINGHSIQTELALAFRELGFCPQFSALFPRITVWEHLLLYSRLHGFTGAAAQARSLLYMRKMGIQAFKDVRCAALSGGTQRKVSIAIALIGDPRAVLLDEPSSGIDPATRRFLWDIVREHSAGRATVLTTHSMEEADALCSKIAIMTAGKMRCIGSPQHLKNKFSTGYTLELKSINSNEAAINQFVQQQFPGAVSLEEYDGFYKYRVENVPTLASVFKALEDARGPLQIEEYSFSQPSLEQIFLDFAKRQNATPEN